MAVVTTAVVGTAVALKGQADAKKAQKQAAAEQRAAALESAEFIAEAGAEGEKDILAAQQEAAQQIGLGAAEAEAEIAPFVAATGGYDAARDLILGGQPLSGPLADLIRQSSLQAGAAPILETSGAPVQREMQRQAGLSVAGATPGVTEALLAQGATGMGALGDVISARQRGLEGLADIASGTAASRASALVGQAPQLQQLAAAGQEARMLGQVAGQQARAQTAETLAKLAGRVF